MKTKLSEGKFLLYTILSTLLLMSTHLLQPHIDAFYNPRNYVGFHTLLESFSVSVSSGIVLYGLKNFSRSGSSRMLFLAFTFFIVGSLDLFHTLTFKGMPYLITESSIAKASWFWIAARSFQAVFIFLLLLMPNRTLKRDYRFAAILLGAILTAAIGFCIFYFEKELPLLVIEGQGTTLLKNSFEYGISFIQFISLIIALYHYYMVKGESNLALALAFLNLVLSELVFTVYHSVMDFDNFMGHIFKVVGFYFILKSFYFTEENSKQEQGDGLRPIDIKAHQKNSSSHQSGNKRISNS